MVGSYEGEVPLHSRTMLRLLVVLWEGEVSYKRGNPVERRRVQETSASGTHIVKKRYSCGDLFLYGSTSPIRKRPPPLDPPRTLDIGLW